MHDALAALPGVEKDTVKVNKHEKQATFRVNSPKEFKTSDAIAAVKDAGFTASVAGSGKAVRK